MPAALFNLNLEVGTDQSLDIFWQNPDGTPVNLTGFIFKAQVKWTVDDPTAIFTWQSGGVTPGILVNPLLGKLTLVITNSQGAGLRSGVGVWDLFAISPTDQRTRLVRGNAVVSQRVTSPP